MEVLSPAGNLSHINSALKAGSNAVYGGFKSWNARNSAINFSKEEYNYSLELLHKNNIKFYLTLNNLFLDDEINDIIDFLSKEDVTLPDAFIATDIGLITVLRNKFPNIDIHVSTQFGVHNLSDIKLLQKLGVKRVIVARELTLEELNFLKSNSDMEIETFIWGSQCLSFSGLCFFGSLINGGTGNRGKCLNLCRDFYKNCNEEEGTLLYVSDMNCINLLDKMGNIDSIKIEGRRRLPEEIEKVISEIKQRKKQEYEAGFLYGESNNNMINKFNARIKPVIKANKMTNISSDDIFVRYENNKIIELCNYDNKNAYYIYSEYLDSYDVNKKNYFMELKLDNNNTVLEVAITNYKGEFTSIIEKEQSNDDYIILESINQFKKEILKNVNENIEIIKVKYIKNCSDKLKISKYLVSKLNDYFITVKDVEISNNPNFNFKLQNFVYLQTEDLNVVEKYINNKNIKIIFDITSVYNLKKIDNIIDKYNDKIIYRLPLFNWKSENLLDYYKKLENKEVMFTRYSQLFDCQNIKFSKKYIDYTIYCWNMHSRQFLLDYGVDEFTASPELSFNQNSIIFSNVPVQYILAGCPSLIYTRNCLKNVLNCQVCNKNSHNLNYLYNYSKNLKFNVVCKQEHREIYYENPILNDYTQLNILDNIKFRIISQGLDFNNIDKLLKELNNENYYEMLMKDAFWSKSYQCNLFDGKN